MDATNAEKPGFVAFVASMWGEYLCFFQPYQPVHAAPLATGFTV